MSVKEFIHPNTGESIHGTEVEFPAVMEKEFVYESIRGWQPCPSEYVGTRMTDSFGAIWVSPVEEAADLSLSDTGE